MKMKIRFIILPIIAVIGIGLAIYTVYKQSDRISRYRTSRYRFLFPENNHSLHHRLV